MYRRYQKKLWDASSIVLDYLPYGDQMYKTNKPLILAIGTNTFKLQKIIPKPDQTFEILEEIDLRKKDKIIKIIGTLSYDQLTNAAQSVLLEAIEKIVRNNEKKYVDFFNRVGPISIRMHALELLSHIGKKYMNVILEEREKKPFESFEDIKKRIKMIPDPVKIISERIFEEITNPDEKFKLFVKW